MDVTSTSGHAHGNDYGNPPTLGGNNRTLHAGKAIPNINVSAANVYYGQAAPYTANSTVRSNSGRPRKASIALNEAYNRNRNHPPVPQNPAQPHNPDTSNAYTFGTTDSQANIGPNVHGSSSTNDPQDRPSKCELHGEDCDGETVTGFHLTETSRRGRGFKDLYPVVENKGRVMVDWHRLMFEEMEKMEAGGF